MNRNKAIGFLNENPHVYKMFEREAFRAIERGFKHYSARTIMEWLRHNSAMQADPTGLFKINNDLIPFLARMFMEKNKGRVPENFFQLRTSMADEVKYVRTQA